MVTVRIIDNLKCMGCGFHVIVGGDSDILGHTCWKPITDTMFDCPNRDIVYYSDANSDKRRIHASKA